MLSNSAIEFFKKAKEVLTQFNPPSVNEFPNYDKIYINNVAIEMGRTTPNWYVINVCSLEDGKEASFSKYNVSIEFPKNKYKKYAKTIIRSVAVPLLDYIVKHNVLHELDNIPFVIKNCRIPFIISGDFSHYKAVQLNVYELAGNIAVKITVRDKVAPRSMIVSCEKIVNTLDEIINILLWLTLFNLWGIGTTFLRYKDDTIIMIKYNYLRILSHLNYYALLPIPCDKARLDKAIAAFVEQFERNRVRIKSVVVKRGRKRKVLCFKNVRLIFGFPMLSSCYLAVYTKYSTSPLITINFNPILYEGVKCDGEDSNS